MSKNTATAVLAFAAGVLLSTLIPYTKIVGWVLVGVGLVMYLQK